MEKKTETKGVTGFTQGLYRDYRGHILGIYIGIMEKKPETTILGSYRV